MLMILVNLIRRKYNSCMNFESIEGYRQHHRCILIWIEFRIYYYQVFVTDAVPTDRISCKHINTIETIFCVITAHIWHPWLWSTPNMAITAKRYRNTHKHIRCRLFCGFCGSMSPYNFKANFSFKMRTLLNKTIGHHIIYGPVNNAKSISFFYWK